MNVVLKVHLQGSLYKQESFDQDRIVIGSGENVDLRLKSEQSKPVSPIHAVIERRDDAYFCADMGSGVGTFCNAKPVKDVQIMPGDVLSVGGYQLEFELKRPVDRTAGLNIAASDDDETLVTEFAEPPKTSKPKGPARAKRAPAKKAPLKKTRAGAKVARGTFAPPSARKNLDTLIKPSMGSAVDVWVSWRERVVQARHFKGEHEVSIGVDADNDIVLPLEARRTRKHKFLKTGSSQAVVNMGSMFAGGSLQTKGEPTQVVAVGSTITLLPGQLLKLNLHNENLHVYVRFVDEAPTVAALGAQEGSRELVAIGLAMVLVAMLAMYMAFYSTYELADEDLEEKARKVTIVFKPPVRPITKPKPKKVVKKPTVKRVRQVKDPGKGRRSRTRKVVKKVKPSGGVKTARKSGAGAKTVKPKVDVNKVGLLSAFGGGGVHETLSTGAEGSGALLGDAARAKGQSGIGEDRKGGALGLRGSVGKRDTVAGQAVSVGGKGSGAFGSGTGGLGVKGDVDLNLDSDEIEASSSIDRDAILRIVRRNKPGIRACYNTELNRKKGLGGKILIEWDIGTGGRVVRTRVLSNTLQSARVATCVRRLISGLLFPAPESDEIARVAFPFTFQAR